MIWFIIAACAIALIVLAALVLTIVRFNQLSMARSLCDEAKRQLVVELRSRHALVPAFVGTLQQFTAADFSNVELALASAERAPFGHRGAAAENALTRSIDEAVLIPGTLADKALAPDSTVGLKENMREELETTTQLLHGQLTVIAERIVAGARIYNTNVDRYHRQRKRFLSRLFRGIFKAREPFAEAGGPAVGRTAGAVDEPRPEPERTLGSERGTVES